MRSDRRREEAARKKQRQRGRLSTILAFLYIAVLAVFVVTVFLVDVLPLKFFLALLAVLAIISIPLLRALLRKNRRKRTAAGDAVPKRKTASSVIALLLMLVMLLGIRSMWNTLGFFSSISGDSQTQNFYVVVRADSSYEELSDISGETVSVLNEGDAVYREAQSVLRKEVDIDLQEAGAFHDVAAALIAGDTEVIFLNSAYYELALEEVEGFTKESTRILYTVDVEVQAEKNAKAVDVTREPFNVYISGIDTTGSIGNISRSDVNMLMTVHPKTRTILLTSIPRDYYVRLAGESAMDKLTHSGLYGIEETTSTVEQLLGIDINYYVKVNFTTVVKLVDTLGGITVNSEYDFSATGLDGTTYNFVEGPNQLGGDAALAFARERYSFASGDNQRVKNQQAVISGIIDRCASSTTILGNYNGILNAVEENLQTSLTQNDITSLVKLQLGDMRGWTIRRCSLTGSNLMTPVYSIPYTDVYVMVPDDSSVEEAKQEINAVLAGK